MRQSIIVVVGLAAITLLHAAIRHSPPKWSPETGAIRTGDQFEIDLKRISDGAEFETPTECWIVFLVDPDCKGCQILASSVGGERDLRMGPHWISAADSAGTLHFAQENRLPLARVFWMVGPPESGVREKLRRVGIYGVPTRLIVDQSRTIRETQLGAGIPTSNEMNALCKPAVDQRGR